MPSGHTFGDWSIKWLNKFSINRHPLNDVYALKAAFE